MGNAEPSGLLLNVALLPPADVETEVSGLSGSLLAAGGRFEVDGLRRRAHLTVYMARFPHDAIDAVQQLLAELTSGVDADADAHADEVRHSGYHVTPGKYYEVSYDRTAGLMRLHAALLEQLSPHRYQPGDPPYELYFGPYSEEQRAGARRWGYDLAGDLYRPHITITQFDDVPAGLPTSSKDLSFRLAQIGLFVADPKGAVTDLLATYPLP